MFNCWPCQNLSQHADFLFAALASTKSVCFFSWTFMPSRRCGTRVIKCFGAPWFRLNSFVSCNSPANHWYRSASREPWLVARKVAYPEMPPAHPGAMPWRGTVPFSRRKKTWVFGLFSQAFRKSPVNWPPSDFGNFQPASQNWCVLRRGRLGLELMKLLQVFVNQCFYASTPF